MACQANPGLATADAPAPTFRPPRVLRPGPGTESLAEYVATGGYARPGPGAEVVALAEAAAIRGRGGAGFPLHVKLTAVAGSADPHRVVVANGEEGEPGSVKDRTLLRTRPHLVLDGLRLAAAAVDATDLHVYVSDPASAAAVEAALAEGPPLPRVLVTLVDPAYVAGEESAVVRRLDGGPALPTAKPPRVFEQGVGGHPTVVSNVETLANLALAHTHGPVAYGVGTVLVTTSGDRDPAALVEVPLGTPLRDVIPNPSGAVAVLCGGLFGGLQPAASVLDLPLDHAALRAAGTAMGCGAFHVMSEAGCPVEVVTDGVAYLSRQSARQCGSCFKGTDAMAATLRRLARGEAAPADLEPVRRWTTQLVGRGNCALLDAACGLVGSLFAHWQDAVDAHLDGPACPACAARADDFTQTRLAVAVPN